jgi:long-chain acyl-CoA synthetase
LIISKVYNQAVGKQVVNFASGLLHYGSKKGDNVGIFAKNRAEWVVAEQACYAQSLIPVALYDTLV